MNVTFKDHLHLHFIVLLYGFTAILGKLISVNAVELVCYRMFLAAIGILVVIRWQKLHQKLRLPRKAIWQIVGVGILVALHWITFFGAAKLSNVSVTLGCMASGTLFTSIVEPLVEKRKVSRLEVFIGVIILIGLYIITQFAFDYWQGILLALVSAFLASLFSVFNKQLVREYESTVIAFYEMLTGFVLITILVFASGGFSISPFALPASDMFYLAILAFACTAYAFVANIYLMKRMSAYVTNLAINMEPIYGIILAFLIFGDAERMHTGFYIGAAIILSSIMIYPILKKKTLRQ